MEALKPGRNTTVLIETMLLDRASAPIIESGVSVGKYRIVGQLAQSRACRLYAVEHHLTLAPGVLKVGGLNSLDRMRREATVLAALESPFIPGLLQVGQLPEKYGSAGAFVMERAPGRTLRDLLQRQRRLDPILAVSVALGVAGALGACHRRKIVHADVKPENIMVEEEVGGRTTLIDFGCARAGDAEPNEPLMGTPLYAAPELLEGRGATPACDIFALASVVYECACGKAPRVLSPQRAPVTLNDVVPTSPQLSSILHRALSSDPKARPETIEAFAEQLSAIDLRELVAAGGLAGEAAPTQQDIDTLELAEISAEPPPQAMASRPWKGDLSGLLSLDPPRVWVFAGDPGTDQPQVVEAIEALSERYQMESLDSEARAEKRIELLSGAAPPWVIIFGDLHVLLGEPLLQEARRQGETSRLLVSTHANWELLNTSVNACGLHSQVCLPQSSEQIAAAIVSMVDRARELRRSYDSLRLVLRDAQDDLQSLQQHSV